MRYVLLGIFFLNTILLAAKTRNGLAETSQAVNKALLIGVAHGLPGIDKDVAAVQTMVTNPEYQFFPIKMMNAEATTSKALERTTELASQVDTYGTFFWYFSGHGGYQTLNLQDRSMNIKELRKAIENGRQSTGPLERLVLMFDSCYSGSLLDPIRRLLHPMSEQQTLENFVSIIEQTMSPGRENTYWKKLFVFASSRSNETSNAGANGSEFTVALAKAFNESINDNNTIGEFIKKTQSYTYSHHPVARLVPLDLQNEKMKQ